MDVGEGLGGLICEVIFGVWCGYDGEVAAKRRFDFFIEVVAGIELVPREDIVKGL